MPVFRRSADKKDETAFWLKPQFVAEIQFAEWTNENVLRQASYKGLREDKSARDVTIENRHHHAFPTRRLRTATRYAALR